MDDSSTSHEPIEIGQYQLENLLRNQVRFHFFDLSEGESEAARHPLLAGAEKVTAGQVLDQLSALGATTDAGIVLICENGSKSMTVGRLLGQHSFINVFVVEGGIQALD